MSRIASPLFPCFVVEMMARRHSLRLLKGLVRHCSDSPLRSYLSQITRSTATFLLLLYTPGLSELRVICIRSLPLLSPYGIYIGTWDVCVTV